MTRKILGGLVAALLLSPAVAFAMPVAQMPSADRGGADLRDSARGSGILWGQSLGIVQSPSNTQVDTSFRGPLNDVQPGAQGSGTYDPPQAADPKPVY